MGIEYKNINKSYGKFKVIEDFSLKIEDGEFVVFLGPSGCGKSTLLRILAGLTEIDSGQVFINDLDVTKKSAKDRNIAFVFQNYALYPHMKVRENITISLKLRKVSQDKISAKLDEISKMLAIEELLDRYPRELSGGQQQRVALARALIRNPEVFLMDEPLSNLDAKLRGKMRVEIMSLYQKLKKTTIYVTHDQVEAMTMANRIVLLDQGKIVQVGSPDQLFSKPKNIFVANFIGSGINLFPCQIKNASLKFLDFEVPFNGPDMEGQVAIRPEHLPIKKLEKNMPEAYEVAFVENLGAEKIIHFQGPRETKLVAKIFSNEEINQGDFYKIEIDKTKIHVFDQAGDRYEERKN